MPNDTRIETGWFVVYLRYLLIPFSIYCWDVDKSSRLFVKSEIIRNIKEKIFVKELRK